MCYAIVREVTEAGQINRRLSRKQYKQWEKHLSRFRCARTPVVAEVTDKTGLIVTSFMPTFNLRRAVQPLSVKVLFRQRQLFRTTQRDAQEHLARTERHQPPRRLKRPVVKPRAVSGVYKSLCAALLEQRRTARLEQQRATLHRKRYASQTSNTPNRQRATLLEQFGLQGATPSQEEPTRDFHPIAGVERNLELMRKAAALRRAGKAHLLSQ